MKRVDFLGSGVLVCAVFCLLLGLEWGGNSTYTSPDVIGLLLGFVLLLGGFIFVEGKVSIEPLAPLRIMTNSSLLANYLCNFFSLASGMAIVFNLSLYYQAVQKLSAEKAGLGLVPGVFAGVTGSLLSGVIMQKTGKYYVLTVMAYVVMLSGTFIICATTGWLVHSLIGNYLGMFIYMCTSVFTLRKILRTRDFESW